MPFLKILFFILIPFVSFGLTALVYVVIVEWPTMVLLMKKHAQLVLLRLVMLIAYIGSKLHRIINRKK